MFIVDTHEDLGQIGVALQEHGYAPADVDGVLCQNWLRVLQQGLIDA